MSRKRRRRPQQRPRQRAPGSHPSPAGAPHAVEVLPPPAGRGDGELEVLVGLVATGSLDEHLGPLQAAISRRAHELHRDAAHRAAANLHVGDRVRLGPRIRPQYLRGATGTVTGWAGRSAVVQLDLPAGRFGAGEVRCPALALERLGTPPGRTLRAAPPAAEHDR